MIPRRTRGFAGIEAGQSRPHEKRYRRPVGCDRVRGLLVLACPALVAPAASAAPIPQGCTFYAALYHCFQEEQQECYAFTAAGVGIGGVAGATLGGIDHCSGGYATAGASVGPAYVSVLWMESGGACAMSVVAPGAPYTQAPCVAGAPPDPGWGSLLP